MQNASRTGRESGHHVVKVHVNGVEHDLDLPASCTLADAIRERVGLTGTHLGCEQGVCGACTVLLDGDPVRACLIFAVQAESRQVETVESLGDGGRAHPMQEAFVREGALQCGFCTPGILMLAVGVLARDPHIDDARLKEVMSSNLCRCTGYGSILRAVQAVRDNALTQ